MVFNDYCILNTWDALISTGSECISNLLIRMTTVIDLSFFISIICYELWNILTASCEWCAYTKNNTPIKYGHQSQWPHILQRKSAVACLLGLQIRIPPGA